MDRIDWTKYPTLPEPPTVPEWRDTPEREAYWREYKSLPDLCDRKVGILLLLALDMRLVVGLLMNLTLNEFKGMADLSLLIMGFALFLLMPALCIWFAISRLLQWSQVFRMARKYGFFMLCLRRPNVSREIQDILDMRPAFDTQTFHALWPSAQHAHCAERLMEIASEYWRLPGKMLYPNDPLLFFYFGKSFPCRRNRMVEPSGDFWDDLLQEFKATDEISKLDKSSTLAEMVECLLGSR